MALNIGDKNGKITVLLVNAKGDMIIDRTELQLKDGLLPLRQLKQKWNSKVRFAPSYGRFLCLIRKFTRTLILT